MTDRPTRSLDLLVLGSGVAGLSAAVRAAERHGMSVGVLTKGELDQTTTRWAQGGVAAVLTEDPDSTDLHLADTLAAGAGLGDSDAVRVLVDEGPGRVNELIALGAIFDRDEQGRLELAREGGHSLARIVHAGGAATGAEIERALVAAVHRTATVLHERAFALDLLISEDDSGTARCRGVRAVTAEGSVVEVAARNVLIATGGAGQLFSVTTNPTEATGDGVAMALRAGVAVADIEFVQFHPTALAHPAMPRPLLSEALRGHGAHLLDTTGARFVDELAPRDEVSRAMTERMIELGSDHVWLDATALESFEVRFPTIARDLAAAGLDPATDWLPVAPAAHYLCGGIVTDLDGASSLPGLWAAGEAACSGVHGANRLASNSLLEGMVFGFRVVEALERGRSEPHPTGAMRSVLGPGSASIGVGGRPIPSPVPPGSLTWSSDSATTGGEATDEPDAVAARGILQRAMTAGAGVVRSASSLAEAQAALVEVRSRRVALGTPAAAELHNLVDLGDAMLAAAVHRCESRGAHTRRDHPERDDAFRVRLVLSR